jgi:hypothetical protein
VTALALVGVLAGCGGSSSDKQAGAPNVQPVKQAFVAYLRHKELTYRSVACVPNGRRYRGRPIVRCNVNFGMDPHVEAYCVVYGHGRLTTNHEDKDIPCGYDTAGFTATVVTSSS